MRQLKYLLDGFIWPQQDFFYLQYSCTDLQVVKQTKLFWISIYFSLSFFCSFIPSVHRNRTKSHGRFVFQRGQHRFHGHQYIKCPNSVEVHMLDKEKLLFLLRIYPRTRRLNTEKRVNKQSPGTAERAGEDLSFHSAKKLNAKVCRVWTVGSGKDYCAVVLKCFEPTWRKRKSETG